LHSTPKPRYSARERMRRVVRNAGRNSRNQLYGRIKNHARSFKPIIPSRRCISETRACKACLTRNKDLRDDEYISGGKFAGERAGRLRRPAGEPGDATDGVITLTGSVEVTPKRLAETTTKKVKRFTVGA